MSFQKLPVPCRAVTPSGVPAGWAAAPCGTSKALEAFSFFRVSSLSRNPFVFSAYSGAFPVRARSAFGDGFLSRLIDGYRVPRCFTARSARRGSPRPCSLSMPRACSSRRPFSPRTGIGAGATARVRPPTLTTVPPASHPCSQFTLPTAPRDRRRPYNLRLQRTVTRLLMGASRPQARACS